MLFDVVIALIAITRTLFFFLVTDFWWHEVIVCVFRWKTWSQFQVLVFYFLCVVARYLFTAHLETVLVCALNKWRTKSTLPCYSFTCLLIFSILFLIHLPSSSFTFSVRIFFIQHGRHIIYAITFDGEICTWRSLLTIFFHLCSKSTFG